MAGLWRTWHWCTTRPSSWRHWQTAAPDLLHDVTDRLHHLTFMTSLTQTTPPDLHDVTDRLLHPASFIMLLTQTAPHKMAALTVLFTTWTHSFLTKGMRNGVPDYCLFYVPVLSRGCVLCLVLHFCERKNCPEVTAIDWTLNWSL